MPNTDTYPSIPDERLAEGGWQRQSKTAETVFELPAVSVTGYTLVYEDGRFREAIEAAGIDGEATTAGGESRRLGTDVGGGVSRFFFATALSFRPSLPPGIGPASLRPTVEQQARSEFADDLGARGFEGMEYDGSQRVRTDSGARARLRKLTATLPLDSDRGPEQLDIEGWLAVWVTNGSFRIAGGAYPTGGLEAVLDSHSGLGDGGIDPSQFRSELLSLIRAVR
jgi:hypothetical protein